MITGITACDFHATVNYFFQIRYFDNLFGGNSLRQGCGKAARNLFAYRYALMFIPSTIVFGDRCKVFRRRPAGKRLKTACWWFQ